MLCVVLTVAAWAGQEALGGADVKNGDQQSVDVSWAVRVAEAYRVPLAADITYATVDDVELQLDVYVPVGDGRPTPTLLYFHGGGWSEGYARNSMPLAWLPFLQLGWIVVNIDYRPSSVAPAPAAVEDCLCALRWVARNAATYGIDGRRVVLMGHSAGAHLALTTGMIPPLRFGRGARCGPAPEQPITPVAIINWFGISDVLDLISGPRRQDYAVRWMGEAVDPVGLARSVSPLTYVRGGVPPVITVHGDRDSVVPYTQAVYLHQALRAAGIVNELVTVPGSGHGRFGFDATRDAYVRIFAFLEAAGVRSGQ